MFDNLKGLSGLADLTKPKSLDLGDYDRAASWIRDSAFTAHELGISPGVLRDLLDSWLSFVSQFDNINDHEMLSLTALTILIYIELTGIYYPFNIKSYFEGVE